MTITFELPILQNSAMAWKYLNILESKVCFNWCLSLNSNVMMISCSLEIEILWQLLNKTSRSRQHTILAWLIDMSRQCVKWPRRHFFKRVQSDENWKITQLQARMFVCTNIWMMYSLVQRECITKKTGINEIYFKFTGNRFRYSRCFDMQ